VDSGHHQRDSPADDLGRSFLDAPHRPRTSRDLGDGEGSLQKRLLVWDCPVAARRRITFARSLESGEHLARCCRRTTGPNRPDAVRERLRSSGPSSTACLNVSHARTRVRLEAMEKAISTYEEVMSAAMTLPANERVMLAEHLIDSIDAEDQERIDRLWAEEAQRRMKEIEDGVVTPIPGEEVMRRLRSRYK
jgi:putative addiction module component (TIGR02574 family)